MTSILDGEIADILTDALADAHIPYALTVQHLQSNGDPFNPETEWVDHACTGWVDDYRATDIDGTLIRQTDRKAFVLCSSIDIAPSTTDRLVMDGKSYTIVSVSRDPAGTCHVLQARV